MVKNTFSLGASPFPVASYIRNHDGSNGVLDFQCRHAFAHRNAESPFTATTSPTRSARSATAELSHLNVKPISC